MIFSYLRKDPQVLFLVVCDLLFFLIAIELNWGWESIMVALFLQSSLIIFFYGLKIIFAKKVFFDQSFLKEKTITELKKERILSITMILIFYVLFFSAFIFLLSYVGGESFFLNINWLIVEYGFVLFFVAHYVSFARFVLEDKLKSFTQMRYMSALRPFPLLILIFLFFLLFAIFGGNLILVLSLLLLNLVLDSFLHYADHEDLLYDLVFVDEVYKSKDYYVRNGLFDFVKK